MDIRQLRYFAAIAEQGSFSRAAQVLHVAQPALSLHVRNMEMRLGTALLTRNSRGVEPTEAGTILLRHARVILGQIAVAEEEIRGPEQDPAGEVRLGLPGTIGEILGVPLITAVHARYPRIKLRIAEAMSGFVLDWMRDGQIDLAVLYGQPAGTGILAEALLRENLCFFGPNKPAQGGGMPPSGTPVAFADILDKPLILPGESHGLRDLIANQALALGQALETRIDVDSYGNIKKLVKEGLGWSILPENAIAPEIAAGELAGWPIDRPALQRIVHLAHAAGRPMTNAVAAVRLIARDLLRDLVRSGDWAGATILPAEAIDETGG